MNISFEKNLDPRLNNNDKWNECTDVSALTRPILVYRAGKKIRGKLHTIIKAINYPSPVIINTKRIPRKRWSKQPKWKQLFLLPIFPSFPRNDVSNFVQNKKKKRKNDQHFHPHHTIHFNSKLGPYQPINTPHPSILSASSRGISAKVSAGKRGLILEKA